MKQKFLYWFTIIFITFFAMILDHIADGLGKHYPFIWSILVIPMLIIMHLYPNWKVTIVTAVFYELLEIIAECIQKTHIETLDIVALVAGSIVNWSILSTVGYFRFLSSTLLLKLEEMTITDTMTGLYNRRYFDLIIEKAIPLSKEANYPLLLLMIDIDHFKKINDTYGHMCGDKALKHISEIMKSNIRELDVLSRIGGEEFAILLLGKRLVEGVYIAEKIRHAVESSIFVYEDEQIPITISLGLSIYKYEEAEKFIEKTDKALYKAKDKGRNQLVVTA